MAVRNDGTLVRIFPNLFGRSQPPVDPFDLATTYPKRTEITAHRNGITKPKGNKYASMKGVDPKFRRNARFAAQGSQKAVREARAAKAE
ncbi:hypothetical protein QFC20_002967 [Naganishia adeliensis]|uniref:Uncharacterized protein n=1 Tax=Naganishia adeliensis TaxID=92952 RepID=A0ACC2WGT7_9TREE|nr:hypothetical protein QFC20_002967 [Naganishia adeliensis]